MTVEERGAIVPRFKPEMATLNAGSTNFGLYPIAARNLPFQDWERENLDRPAITSSATRSPASRTWPA